jgi:hypothetical protein
MVFSAETTGCTFGDPLKHGVPCESPLKTTRFKKKVLRKRTAKDEGSSYGFIGISRGFIGMRDLTQK